MNQSRILPFYMAYPLPLYYQEEDTITRDLEYLQQMYPAEAKKYQKIICDILNTMDYEGSCIYDEYPDKWQLYKLTQAVMDKIKRVDRENNINNTCNDNGINNIRSGESVSDEYNNSNINNVRNGNSGMEIANAPEKPWEWIEEFVQVLLYYEIYKKRHANHNGILKF